MGTFKKFEEIEAWQKARILAQTVYKISGAGSFAKDYALKEQIRRTGISIMANIAEGHERAGRKEFIQFLAIAKASSGELRSHLYVALDQDYISKESFEEIYSLAMDTSRMINGLMRYLKQSDISGNKYKVSEPEL